MSAQVLETLDPSRMSFTPMAMPVGRSINKSVHIDHVVAKTPSGIAVGHAVHVEHKMRPNHDCQPKHDCDPCKSSGYGSEYGSWWIYILVIVIVAVLIWIFLVLAKPDFVLKRDENGDLTNEVCHGKAFGWALLFAIIIGVIVWAIWG